MPKCQPFAKQKCKLEREVWIQRRQPELLVEIDQYGFAKDGGWPDARVETHDRRPAHRQYQSLLQQAPIGIDIPAKPWELDVFEARAPIRCGVEYQIGVVTPCVPIAHASAI